MASARRALVDRRGERRTDALRHGVTAARLRPAFVVHLVEVTSGGACIETVRRLLPGSRVEVALTRANETRHRGRVQWCRVVRLEHDAVTYRAGIQFSERLAWCPTSPVVVETIEAGA